MAPEVYNAGEPYGLSADVFSFSILLWCLLAGQSYPYTSVHLNAEQSVRLVAAGRLRPRKLARLNEYPEISDLLENCWAQDPAMRPEMQDVLEKLLEIRDDVEEKIAVEAAICFM